MWQDTIFSIGNLIFIIALFPSIFSKNKPALLTCLLTGITLIAFAITFYTLELWFTVITVSCASTLWLILAAQVIRRKKKS